MEIELNCPRCKLKLDQKNRLVTDHCGHIKCRNCLISDDRECQECQEQMGPSPEQATFQKNSPITKEKILILEDVPILPNMQPADERCCITIKTERKQARGRMPLHIRKETMENGKIKYFCDICNKHFLSRTQQYYHLFCNDKQNKPYKCEHCTESFASLYHFKYHLEGHEQKTFTCMVCTKTFTKLGILRKHEKLHSEKKYSCDECGLLFREKSTFVAHTRRHKGIFLFSCELCEKKFSLKASLNQHKAIHMDGKKFKCTYCGKLFYRNNTLKLHILRHSKQSNHFCTICSKSFNNLNALSRHSNIHKGGIKYKCVSCDITSVRKDNMIRHVRNMHPGVEFLKCIEIIKDIIRMRQNEVPQTKIHNVLPNSNNTPKTVVNSSVIKSIGNVEPVIIPIVTDYSVDPAINSKNKRKKKYDPLKVYRQILNNDVDSNSDEEEEEGNREKHFIATSSNESTSKQNMTKPISTHVGNTSLLNFSERHWRKNLNLRVKEDW